MRLRRGLQMLCGLLQGGREVHLRRRLQVLRSVQQGWRMQVWCGLQVLCGLLQIQAIAGLFSN